MLEATPGRPWGIDFKDLLKVESNMKWRYVCYCPQDVSTVTNRTVQAGDCKVSHGAK
jgi:glutamate--cysteine ligase catalytic subunit